MKYSKTIKMIREKLFLTQDEFAKLLGVSFETVNRWENNKFNPSMKTKKKIYEICQEYSIDMKEIDYE